MWWEIVLLTILGLAGIVAAAVLYGTSRWQSGTKAMHAKLEAACLPITPKAYDPRELHGLPAPVQCYFRAVLREGQPMVSGVRMVHEGQFNMGEAREKWVPFTSHQVVITRRPGFDWDARMRMAPGISVFVHDAYITGEGILHAALFGLVTLADLRGTPEVAQGELMRFLAEAACYPTVLLPSQGVRWDPIDETSARATLTDGSTSVSLEFHFNAEDLIGSVRAEARYRTVNGGLVATPWQGRFWSYELRDGMRIPLNGEVEWQLPNGPWPYWRGRITEISYEFAR